MVGEREGKFGGEIEEGRKEIKERERKEKLVRERGKGN